MSKPKKSMKTKRPKPQGTMFYRPISQMRIFFLFCFLCCLSAQAQGTFRNMDFGLISPFTQPGSAPASSAMPFWTVYLGTNQYPDVDYNRLSFGSADVGILGNDYKYATTIPGHYTAFLLAGTYGLPLVSAAIAQTGQIPPDAMSLLFVANGSPANDNWNVTIGGQTIPVTQLSQASPGYYLFGANISQFAGQTEELRFTANVGIGLGSLFFGEIQFSSSPVPEPSSAGLLLFGSILCGRFIWRRQKACGLSR
jgi:hypothetical protein